MEIFIAQLKTFIFLIKSVINRSISQPKQNQRQTMTYKPADKLDYRKVTLPKCIFNLTISLNYAKK